MFSFGFSLVIAALVGMILYTYLRNRRVSAPRLPGNDGGNIGYAGGAEYREPSPEYQYFESRRDQFLDQLYSRTSSPEIPVTLTLRDWVDQGAADPQRIPAPQQPRRVKSRLNVTEWRR